VIGMANSSSAESTLREVLEAEWWSGFLTAEIFAMEIGESVGEIDAIAFRISVLTSG
jgi:hypothetical protein